MKKWIIIMSVLFLLLLSVASAEGTDDWFASPVFTKAYEISPERLYIEWEGNALLYQVYLDGKSVADVTVNNAIIPIKKGAHTIHVYPISEASATTDTKINVEVKIISFDIDLAALGLDHKNLTAGEQSEPLYIDYTPSPIFKAAPEEPIAITDFNDHIHITFDDKYNSDEYLVTIKSGKDENYVRFYAAAEETASLVTKTNSTVTLILDPIYLASQECIVPELNNEYTISVQLRKYGKELISGETQSTVIYESKESDGCKYTPIAAWKSAPVITYASQTADGQVTLQWTHDDNGLGCEYAVMKLNKALMIQTGSEKVGTTTGTEYVVTDLMNGSSVFTVVPYLNGEEGLTSAEASIDVQNEWVIAPEISVEAVGTTQANLSWTAAAGVESYHIVVYAGNNESLLRFVDLDYNEYGEYDLPATAGEMSYMFTYDGEIDPILGQKLKFEVYGIRHTASNAEQKSSVSSQKIIIGITD